jgi:parvulin-like peptidyl-prolyl isomerase
VYNKLIPVSLQKKDDYMKKIIVFGLAAIILIWGAGCYRSAHIEPEQSVPVQSNYPVAIIDSTRSIMASDLYERLSGGFLLPDGGFVDSSVFFDTLENIVIDSIVSIEASEADLKNSPKLYRTFENSFRGDYLKFLFERLILDSIKTDSTAVDSFYQAHPDYFTQEEQVHVRHILISAKGLRYGADSSRYEGYSMDEIDSIAGVLLGDYREMIESGADFGELARQFSMHEESAIMGGDLGYFRKGTYNPEFEEVVFSLDSGSLSQPFKTSDGWHLAEVLDHIDSGLVPLEEIYARAKNLLITERSQKMGGIFMDSLAGAADFRFNDSALARPAGEVPDSVWAAIINDRDTMFFDNLEVQFHDYIRMRRKDSMSLEEKHNLLKNNSVYFLIAQAGDDLGYDDYPEVKEMRRRSYHDYAMAMIRSKSQMTGYEPPDSLVEDYYQKNIDRYKFKKPVYVQQIIVEDSVFGEFLRDQALSGMDFLELARQYYPGAEEIRVSAADLGYIGPEDMPEAFYQAAMIIPVGEISHPVKTEWGYHIIHVVDRKISRTLDEVRGQIVSELKNRRREKISDDWRQGLLSRHTVVYNLGPLEKVYLPPKKERMKESQFVP